ncbi:MAG TPA: hypothetical protein VGY48_14775 [Vicinamibacterales bacterium]|jgi:hypothetical protein|nr:hypothetical protein [Vicinamibacterales bacterium]
MTLLIAACAAAAALGALGAFLWGARRVAVELAGLARDTRQARQLTLLQTFAPAIAASQGDARAILVWEPLARASRALFPEDLAALDRATGATFPFSADRIQAAHAQWTADWLAWERSHDAEYKQRAAEAERAFDTAASSDIRSRIDAIEREKLERYQRRYEEYVRVAKALKSLAP